MPKRIQRKREKGWRKPENTVNITRPGPYGNRFRVGDPHPGTKKPMTAQDAVDAFEEYQLPEMIESGKTEEIRGKDVMCFCALDAPCHGDPLLRASNRPRHQSE